LAQMFPQHAGDHFVILHDKNAMHTITPKRK